MLFYNWLKELNSINYLIHYLFTDNWKNYNKVPKRSEEQYLSNHVMFMHIKPLFSNVIIDNPCGH